MMGWFVGFFFFFGGVGDDDGGGRNFGTGRGTR